MNIYNARKSLTNKHNNNLYSKISELVDYSKKEKIELDVYGVGLFLNQFEKNLAKLFGFKSALFVPSGTMGQLIAMRIHCDRVNSNSIAMHQSSHPVQHENNAYKHLHNFKWRKIGLDGKVLSSLDLKDLKNIGSILIELPMRDLGCETIKWEDLEKIKKEKNAPIHLDGARIWEIQPFYNRSFAEIVSGFDSAYISFYKGLGALPGAAILGDIDFIKEARIWLRRYGGNLFNQTIPALSAFLSINNDKKDFYAFWLKAKEIAKIASFFGCKIIPSTPNCNTFRISSKISKDILNKHLEDLYLNESIYLFKPFSKITNYESMTEIVCGNNTLDWTKDEIINIFSKVFVTI